MKQVERYFYPAVFSYAPDQEIAVTFPDLDVATSGTDDTDALLIAATYIGDGNGTIYRGYGTNPLDAAYTFKNGRIYVNGKKTKAFSSQKILSAGLAADEITLKSKQYFVVGDNYNNSEDSRSASVGNIKRTNIIGKVGIKYWPW
jgi:hypothetical protein